MIPSSLSLGSYLLSEDGFGLTTETLLLAIVSATTLGSMTFLGLLVLRHLVHLMRVAFPAVGATLFWYIDL